MAGGKASPRQQMINMMYLVLTALLAMNVSKEILDAFVIVNDGLERTKANFKSKNDTQYNAFKASFDENPQKVRPYWKKAQTVQSATADLITYIDEIKAKVISTAESKPLEAVIGPNEMGIDTVLSLEHVEKKDDNNNITNIMIGAEPAAPKDGEYSAKDLKKRLEEYRDEMLDIVEDTTSVIYGSIKRAFTFDKQASASGTVENWESRNFYHVPLAAGVTILSKIQTDIRNTESDVVKYLYSAVDAASFKFNKLEAAVIAPSNYIIRGDTFRAQVFLAAFDTTQSPQIMIGTEADSTGYEIAGSVDTINVVNGKGMVRFPTSSEGLKTWKGIINFKAPGGRILKYPFDLNYQVAVPSLVVSPTKMNVFYKGVDNPVDISVPGVPGDKITATINNGTMTKAAGGGYVVKVRKGTSATISVSAEMPDGSKKSMGTSEFRVKSVPDPKPYFAGKSVGDDQVKKAQLTAAQGVIAKMENFDFDLKFNITQFRMTMIVGGTPIEKIAKGAYLTPDMKKMVASAKRGQKVYIENIKAKGPDGTIRNLGSLSLKVL